MWQEKLAKICENFKIEPLQESDRIIFMCPKMPEEKTKVELVDIIPKSMRYEFIEAPKTSTIFAIRAILIQLGAYKSIVQPSGRTLKIEALNLQSIDSDNPAWDSISQLLKKDGFFTAWEITFNDNTIKYDLNIDKEIEKQHHIRDHRIQGDDITNLKIILNSTQDVNDFLKELG